MRSYLEMIQLPTFEDRFEYLKLNGKPSELTFGGHRLLNQYLYQKNQQWKDIRRKVIIRDNGCDLACEDRPLNLYNKDLHKKKDKIANTHIIIHHINPITVEQMLNNDPMIFSMNNLVCCSLSTHNAIHYGSIERLTPSTPIERRPGDTKLW